MNNYTEAFANKIVEVCVSKYKSLKKTGKPKTDGEWTLLSCFVQEERGSDTLKVVALGTGSKCIGARLLPKNGDILHDSHAEVVARRAFVLYLTQQVRSAADGHVSIFQEQYGMFYLKPDISFHLYTSHTPCGDASIFPKQERSESVGKSLNGEEKESACTTSISLEGEHLHDLSIVADTNCTSTAEGENLHRLCKDAVSSSDTEVPTKKRKLVKLGETNNMNCTLNTYDLMKTKGKQLKEKGNDDEKKITSEESESAGNIIFSDTFRTGAKCVSGENPDPQLPGSDYHVTGVLRTKPGRGDPTLSMSCSDKILKWTVLGVQGALLMLLLDKPVYVSTLVIGQCPYSQEAMSRAVYGRFQEKLKGIQMPKGYFVHAPLLLKSQVEFPHSRSYISGNDSGKCKLMPTPTSIIWSDTSIHTECQEVATNGRRLGCTKKSIGTPQSWVSICRKSISNQVLDLVKDRVLKQQDCSQVSYRDLKFYSNSYLQAWKSLRTECLPNWTEKPKHLQDFKIVFGKPSI